MSTPSEIEQPRARLTASEDILDWQSELDASMADIDARLTHPRRRASDRGVPPRPPELDQLNLTSEVLDEIAWRVAEQMRKTTPAAPEPEPARLAPAAALTIRIRKPLFRFWRRRTRREALISFSDYRIT